MPLPSAEIGIFGGSGFYAFLQETEEVAVPTPFGHPSDRVAVGEVGGRRVAFIPRHGRKHTIPPHAINYRANVWALHELGVTRVLGPCAAGSLSKQFAPGHVVVCDQLVDRTKCRKDTFYDGPVATHVAFADPYCPELRPVAVAAAGEAGITVHDRGTVVVIEGPRFSTRAESAFYASQGWEVINMTQYPEAVLARELEMCYANISLITDYDIGFEDHPPVTVQQVVQLFRENTEHLRRVLAELIPRIPETRSCPCGTTLEDARVQ